MNDRLTIIVLQVKNYFQRRIDSGQKDFEDIVADAERKKARGEPTGPLPVPSVPPKRRYEATPSSIMPRPLAPHTDAVDPDKNKSALSSQPVPLHTRAPSEKDRNVTRFPPLAQAQASTAPMTTGAHLSEDPRAVRAPAGLPPQRVQGPKMGFFTEDRRDPLLPHTTPRAPESQFPTRQTPMAEMARMDPLHPQTIRSSTVDLHGSSPLLAAQSTAPPPPQQSYMQSQPQPSLVPSHSRHPSLSKPPGSPVPPFSRLETEISPIRRDSVNQRPLYPLPSQPASVSQVPAPVLSPPKELSRPSSTPAEPPEAPRQVPAKRSNIMSILNDEPEEPQPPQKRFASDQGSSTPAASTVSPSRPVYAGIQSLSQQAHPSRQEEPKMPSYPQPSPNLGPSRSYADYQPYPSVSAGSGSAANNDWMSRFDPRGQQQQQPPPQSLSSRSASMAPQPPYSPYAPGQPQSGPSLTNLTAPSPAPTPSPAPIQRPYQSSMYGQSPAVSRELPSQTPVYRQSLGSPPPRNSSSSLAYGSSRQQGPQTPIQSSTGLLNMASRPPSGAPAPYGSAASTPTPTHLSASHQPSAHQSYQQHVQTMVSGAHQQQAHRSTLGLTGGQYGHSTPPPPATTSRSTAGPPGPPLSLGRSYTPPAILQPNPSGGLSYAPGGPSSVVGSVHPLHARHPAAGSLSDAAPGPGPGPPGGPSHHHRVYSQGSNPGPLPGPLNPQPPR